MSISQDIKPAYSIQNILIYLQIPIYLYNDQFRFLATAVAEGEI